MRKRRRTRRLRLSPRWSLLSPKGRRSRSGSRSRGRRRMSIPGTRKRGKVPDSSALYVVSQETLEIKYKRI